MADAKTFRGWVTELGVGIPVVVAAAPVAIISGAISAARGDTFDEGYDKIVMLSPISPKRQELSAISIMTPLTVSSLMRPCPPQSVSRR